MPIEWHAPGAHVGPRDAAAALASLARRRPDLNLSVSWLSETGSTMDEVAARADHGAPAGTIVGADRQTAGRGRRGHVWASPPRAGLYFSYLLRPRGDVSLITLAAGVAVIEALASVGVSTAELKWPNDVMVGRRKLAGVLTEAAHLATPEAMVVVGLGLNLEPAAYPPDVASRAVSLADAGDIAGAAVGGHLLAALLEALHDAWQHLEDGRHEEIRHRWMRSSASAVGARVTWHDARGAVQGLTDGIDGDGALRVRTPHGVERVVGGAVIWEHLEDTADAPRGCDV